MGWKYINMSNLCSICVTVKTRVKICAQFPGLRRQSMLIAIFAIPAEAIVEMDSHMGMGQNPIPLVNVKIAGKWMFIPLKMVCIGIDP